MDPVEEFFKSKKIAVVGSFKDETKVAWRIVRYLKKRNVEIYPVNPNAKEVEGIKVIQTFDLLPDDIEAVDFVTPPDVTEELVKKCLSKKIKKVWMQPGADSDAAENFCKENGISVIRGACIMLQP